MAKMNALRKKAAINKYGKTIKVDYAAAEAQMQADKYSPEEIFEIVEAVNETPEAPAPAKAHKAEKAVKADQPKGLNPIYEKWKVDVTYERDEDGDLVTDKKGRNIPIITKNKLIRTVKISIDQAKILNDQMVNTKEGYYLQD